MSSANPLILIASATFDEHTHGPVRDHLVKMGFDVVVYQTDRVMAGTDHLRVAIDHDGTLAMQYEGRPIGPQDVAACWYWKPSGFRLPDAENNVAKQLSLVSEIALWNATLWGLFPDELWLNSPNAVARADRKLEQLLVAQSVGFSIPASIVSSSWGDVDAALTVHGELIVKMLRGVLADQNTLKAMFTTRIDEPLLNHLREVATPFPGLYQAFIPKAREWRVTIVGDQVFSIAIYTDDDAKDDWRRMQLTPAVQFRNEPLPRESADRCLAYLAAMHLGYGAFDLVEQPDGSIVFLECNPNGQHNWLEQECGIPVSRAIASRLSDIALS